MASLENIPGISRGGRSPTGKPYNTDILHRRSIRLRNYPLLRIRAYFVTVCAQNREGMFGESNDGAMVLNDAGRMVEEVWQGLSGRLLGVVAGEFVVMPNHFHGIIIVDVDQGVMDEGAINCAPTGNDRYPDIVGARFIAPKPISKSTAPHLGEIIRTFKAVSTWLIRRNHTPEFAWQRNYYERVIRKGRELADIRG